MANPYAGEVAIWLDGVRHAAKLTLGALAELEASFEAGSLIEMVERFEQGGFPAATCWRWWLQACGAAAGQGAASDLRTVEIGGGPDRGGAGGGGIAGAGLCFAGEG